MNYRIGDFNLRIWSSDHAIESGLGRMLPTFEPFIVSTEPSEPSLLDLQLSCRTTDSIMLPTDARLIESSADDLGYFRLSESEQSGYWVELRHRAHTSTHYLTFDPLCLHPRVSLNLADPFVGNALSSLIRILFSQAILYHQAVAIHASAVVYQGRAYLFLGRSGTGKSTHSRLWLHALPSAHLLNDDNPLLRFVNGELYAYGSPWSGKTSCHLNERARVGAILRLRQASHDHYWPLTGVEAFKALLPSCFAIRRSAALQELLASHLSQIVEAAPIGLLDCRPDPQAAQLSISNLIIS
ncbi:MAG: phosphoenolpyruvate carboxykinase [Bacteroidales bacterium]|nr:phosphoenolpyruvate carboxykinase [Bacteroidales bacterium]